MDNFKIIYQILKYLEQHLGEERGVAIWQLL